MGALPRLRRHRRRSAPILFTASNAADATSIVAACTADAGLPVLQWHADVTPGGNLVVYGVGEQETLGKAQQVVDKYAYAGMLAETSDVGDHSEARISDHDGERVSRPCGASGIGVAELPRLGGTTLLMIHVHTSCLESFYLHVCAGQPAFYEYLLSSMG
jgi:hypothetical protein